MCCTEVGRYFKDGWRDIKPHCWNGGWILPILKLVFFFLSFLSAGLVISECLERRYGSKYRYLFVDSYVTIWLISIVIISNFAIKESPLGCIILGFWSYRLFEIFQSWFSQHVLGGVPRPWKSRNVYRTLVIIFIDYGAVIFSYAFLAFILQDNFNGIDCWQRALNYSLGNAITIGSGITPTTCVGYTLLFTQIMFTILFLTSAVNRIIAATKS